MKQDIKNLLAVGTLEEILAYMQQHGQSVLLNWGEDNNLWECAWISGGDRTVEFSSRDAASAARTCLWSVMEKL